MTMPSPAADSYAFLPLGEVQHAARGCPGQYIMGVVLDRLGGPLSNVRLRVSDQWGNESVTLTKSGPTDAGRCDFPLFPPDSAAMTYSVVVVDSDGNDLSPHVTVAHRHNGLYRDAGCHWVDWQEPE